MQLTLVHQMNVARRLAGRRTLTGFRLVLVVQALLLGIADLVGCGGGRAISAG